MAAPGRTSGAAYNRLKAPHQFGDALHSIAKLAGTNWHGQF